MEEALALPCPMPSIPQSTVYKTDWTQKKLA
jgi:hypothetical protein